MKYIEISFRDNSEESIESPIFISCEIDLYSWGDPSPYMQETEATIIVSFLVNIDLVEACLSLSISSFISDSFSM